MKTTVSIPGMHCNSCAALVKDVSSEFPAIKNVNIDIATKRVELDHSEELDMNAWTREIESLGEKYKVRKIA
ncbi:heavy-metal-associated domain-containing protein [Candidatus Peregrinibacteria bacterium]|nr:heavy-metal-associated domain-containing protein [Candidatus Peregrinibacteria bacterium]